MVEGSNYTVALAPKIKLTEQLKEWIKNGTGIKNFKFFKNEEEITNYIKDPKYGDGVEYDSTIKKNVIKNKYVCFGISFDEH